MVTDLYPDRKPIPSDVRHAVERRARGLCEDCGDRQPLELHHLTYNYTVRWPDLPEPIFGHETPEDLRALCRACHHARHVDANGQFWADPEEMENYWSSFYDEVEKG